MFADGRGHGPEYAERRHQHHVIGVAKHDLRERLTKLHHRAGFGANSRAGRSEDKREYYDLKHLALRHRLDDTDWECMLQDLSQARRSLLNIGLRAPTQRHSETRLDEVGSAESNE